jgi:predicted transposase
MFISLQFKLELKKEDKEKLIQLMRKQSSAIRVAYNMLNGRRGWDRVRRSRLVPLPAGGTVPTRDF